MEEYKPTLRIKNVGKAHSFNLGVELGLGASATGITFSITGSPTALINPPWRQCNPVNGSSADVILLTKNPVETSERSELDVVTNFLTFGFASIF